MIHCFGLAFCLSASEGHRQPFLIKEKQQKEWPSEKAACSYLYPSLLWEHLSEQILFFRNTKEMLCGILTLNALKVNLWVLSVLIAGETLPWLSEVRET